MQVCWAKSLDADGVTLSGLTPSGAWYPLGQVSRVGEVFLAEAFDADVAHVVWKATFSTPEKAMRALEARCQDREN